MTAPAFTFTRHGRSWGTLIAVIAVWAVILVGWLWFAASALVLAILAVFTLPALWDVWTARQSGVSLTEHGLTWHSGPNTVTIAREDIDHVRLVTRLDLTVRAAVVLTHGRKLRLPAEATPPHTAFEDALRAQDIRSERHHFTFL